MKTVKAKITWNTQINGCIESPFSGIQPSMLVDGDLVMARIERQDGEMVMERGETYDVFIKLPYGEHYAEHLMPGMNVCLQVGERLIGIGTVDQNSGD